jgi:hypothetical protein
MLLLFSLTSLAQTKPAAALTDGAALLFKNIKSKLSNTEKNWLYKQLGLTLLKDKKKFMADEYDVIVVPFITDINKDAVEEVFIVLQSSALFGNTGESFSMFTKNKTGNFEKQPDLGAGIAMILYTKNMGYPDIAIGGPGFEFPAYRWDGKKYKYFKKIKDADLQSGKLKYMDLDKCSKLYSETLN